MKVARVIYQELGIGAVAITDRDKLLAFIGIGDDHHLPGTPIARCIRIAPSTTTRWCTPTAISSLTAARSIRPAS